MELRKINGKQRLIFSKRELKSQPFEGTPVLGISDTIYIGGCAYAKTEEAFQLAKKAALDLGYDDSITKADDRHKGIYFSLNSSNAAECGSCSAVISQTGVHSHNHKCENCGEPTFLEYTRDGAISLEFMKEGNRIGRSSLSFRIFGYREHEDKPNELLLFPNPILGNYSPPPHEKRSSMGLRRSLFAVRDLDEARLILEEAKDCYSTEAIYDPVTGQDIKVMVLKDITPNIVTEASTFETREIVGQIHNHKNIKVYNGKKYEDFETLPIPDHFELTRAYIGREKHSLAEPDIHETIISAAGQVSRVDFYYQDGRKAFDDVAYKRMTDFVENFVDIDPEEWAVYLSAAPQDGPGFIHSLASWCAAMSDGQKRNVRDEPNIGNAMVGMAKLVSGQKLSYAESVAMIDGAETPEAERIAAAMLHSFNAQKEGEASAFRQRLATWVKTNEGNQGEDKPKPDDFDSGMS